ncbi:cupin domain-containing protein [Hyalangium rubrum]|uniref:Cupin domain-containing protein n=1 Tax=Hyalangium rubrum TaxID=3103134 RepID=A0ABU5H9E7_9BACT|nr:cupin domain-containing protein [Hyalangium sp. s54d21]MDY7230105.1 cupin domain-containing protein [Hyalangium sp. s54d21]
MTRHRLVLPVLGAAVFGIAALSWAREPVAAVRYRVSTREAPRHLIAEGKGSATLLLNASTGASAASVTLLELGPGAAVPEHTHEASAEILYIEDGAAEMAVDGQKLKVERGDAVYIPAGAKHSARVVSEGPMRAVQVYAGPGPEQRFTQGPRVDTKDKKDGK